jgi:hypothetical protein
MKLDASTSADGGHISSQQLPAVLIAFLVYCSEFNYDASPHRFAGSYSPAPNSSKRA